jgi:hypothetical protein
MPVLVVAIILNMIYTIVCVVCLTTTCCKNTRFRTAADPLNNDQRFIFLLVCKMCECTNPYKLDYTKNDISLGGVILELGSGEILCFRSLCSSQIETPLFQLSVLVQGFGS